MRTRGTLILVVAIGITVRMIVSAIATSETEKAHATSLPENAASSEVQLPRDGTAFERLSEYNLFLDFATQTPNKGVVPYDLATPLFTDYASKHRFVYMPDGRAAQYDPERMFAYPVGTILVKTFGYLNDIRDESEGEELIETRLLIRDRRNWTAWTYVYDDDTEDAVLEVDGASRHVAWTHYDGNERSIDYIVPTAKDCRGCHNERYNIVPIGPKAWNLNHDYEYGHGTENQLSHWSTIGILDGAPEPEAAPALPAWDDVAHATLDERARAYLEVNCAHCHNPNGPANDSGLDLRWIQDDPYALGVNRALAQRDEDRNRVDGFLDNLFGLGGGNDREERRRDDGERDRRRRDDDDDDRGRDRRRRDNDNDRERQRGRDGDRDRGEGNGGFDRTRDERDFGEGPFDPAGRAFDIVPGKPDESIMVYRMESLVPTATMPKAPHRLVHEEGVALIREWIESMDENGLDPTESDTEEDVKFVQAVDPPSEPIQLGLAERE